MSVQQVEVLVPIPILEKFSYLLPSQFKDNPPRPGTRVIVPFGNRNLVGVVWDVKKNITAKGRKLKNIKDEDIKELKLTGRIMISINFLI